MSSKIKAYFMRVGKETGQIYRGYFGELENTLRAKQDYVGYDEPGNLIQVIRLTRDIDVVMNDEGKLKGIIERQLVPVLTILGNAIVLEHESKLPEYKEE